jgi:hypothetical protein
MSPSESELRASLHTGEGERLDADSVLARARAAKRERRRNLVAMGGAVAAVLAVGGVVAAVQLNHSGHPQAVPTAPPTAPPATSGPAPNQLTPGQVAPGCPRTPPIPRSGNPNAPGDLFPADVTSITVCYFEGERMAASKVLDGQVAKSVAQMFNDLPLARHQMCPLYQTDRTIALLPRTSGGTAPTVVGTIGGCGQTTNGTVSRNATAVLAQLETGLGIGTSPVVPSGNPKSHGPAPS